MEETFSALLAPCGGNPLVTGWFPSQRPVMRSIDLFFDLRLKNVWANNLDAGDLRRHRAHYDVTGIILSETLECIEFDSAMSTGEFWYARPIFKIAATKNAENPKIEIS